MAKALTEMTPDQIVKEMLDSGLRGRVEQDSPQD